MNKLELQAEIVRNGYTYNSLAGALGISENALWRKINGHNEFTLWEIRILIEKLKLDDQKIKQVFFS